MKNPFKKRHTKLRGVYNAKIHALTFIVDGQIIPVDSFSIDYGYDIPPLLSGPTKLTVTVTVETKKEKHD